MAGQGRFRVIKGDRHSDPLRFWPKARRKAGWLRFLPLWGGAIGVGLMAGIGWANWHAGTLAQPGPKSVTVEQYAEKYGLTAGAGGATTTFTFCHTGGGHNCVVDGDTIWFQGQKIRVADIDAPETHEPKCAAERERGDRATQRLIQLVNSGDVTLRPIDRDEDRYGRKLRIVMVDGESVGDALVSEGLARWYEGGRRSWC